jgi:putative flippase GtrA
MVPALPSAVRRGDCAGNCRADVGICSGPRFVTGASGVLKRMPSDSVTSPAARYCFLIPAYRPDRRMLGLIEELTALRPDVPVYVVNDGSEPSYDSIFEAASKMPRTAVGRNAVNLGKGAAIKKGINDCLVLFPGLEGTVTADGDGQHAAKDIVAVLAALSEKPNSFILGARQFDAAVPLKSRVGNTISRFVYRGLIGLRLTDTQTGLRGLPRVFCEHCLSIRSNRYEFETEMLILAKANGLRFEEVPIKTIYIDNNRGTHFDPVWDSLKIYFVLLRYTVSSIVTAITDLAAFVFLESIGLSITASNFGSRAVALWVQFALLKKFVFHAKAGLPVFFIYVGYVMLTGYVSALMQGWISVNLFNSVLGSKMFADSLIFIFNFLFLRDLVFRKSDA